VSLLVGAALATPHVPIDDDPFGPEPRYEHPESVEVLRQAYEQAARDIAEAQARVPQAIDKPDGYELYHSFTTAWCHAHEMSVALNWLLLGELPIHASGAPRARWVEEWFCGPWPARRP
jgi:hypothetical protein